MNDPFPLSASVPFVILIVVLLALLLAGLRKGLTGSGKSPAAANKITLFTASGLAAWILFLGLLAHDGFFTDFSIMPPRFLLAIAVPMITICIFTFSDFLKKTFLATPLHWMIALQAFRIPMEFILWELHLQGVIPVQMSFEGRNLDILSGILAIPAAWYISRHPDKALGIGVAYNIIGLALLLNIVITASLSTPAPFRVFMNEPANTMIAYLPFIWLPGFVVPVAFAMHFFSLKQLMLKNKYLSGEKPASAVMR